VFSSFRSHGRRKWIRRPWKSASISLRQADLAGVLGDDGDGNELLGPIEQARHEPGILIAHCHLGLGKLYRRTDKREQAQEHLSTATTMYREMGMMYWLEKADAEMMELGR